MEDRGLQDDPRYSALLAMRAKQGGMAPPSPGPPMDPNRYEFSVYCSKFTIEQGEKPV